MSVHLHDAWRQSANFCSYLKQDNAMWDKLLEERKFSKICKTGDQHDQPMQQNSRIRVYMLRMFKDLGPLTIHGP